MPIHWFPGHMNRARREIADALAKVDVVVELVDARLPLSSRNPLLAKLAANKPIQTLFSKADLADPVVTEAWLDSWPGPRPLALRATEAKSVRPLVARCRALAPQRGGPGRTLRLMVVGIPNVGKSTLINSLIGKHVAKTGDKPAITRHAQRVELERDVSIFDSPGVLWPRLDDQEGARRLAASGAIGDAAFDLVEIACWSVLFAARRYAPLLIERYDVADELDRIFGRRGGSARETGVEDRETDGPDPDAGRAVALLEAIGRRRGALRAGGRVDLERAADAFVRDLRSGKLGRLSFESPADFASPADYRDRLREDDSPEPRPEPERERDRPEPPRGETDSSSASSAE